MRERVGGMASPEVRGEVWACWRRGDRLSDIAHSLGVRAGSVYAVLRARGGFAPAERRRAARALALGEREEISRSLSAGLSIRRIAACLGRAASTISREIARNGGAAAYRAAAAEARAWRVAARPKPCRLAEQPHLAALVATKLAQRWSPQQIARWLKQDHGTEAAMQVSHETIYKSLFIQARGVLRRELTASLRSRRPMRRPRAAQGRRELRGDLAQTVSIRARPAEAEDRAVPGHWEGDLLSGKGNTHIATLVERWSRYVVLVKLASRQSEDVVDALIAQARRLPEGLMRSLTWDRGKEMAQHRRFSLATDVAVYFCDPASPWQRGSNENTNGLLRQYLPKGTDLSVYSQHQLDQIADELNGRPRMTLHWDNPAATFFRAVAVNT